MFYVYKWYIVKTGEVFYIGKGCNKRAGQRTGRNKLFKEVIKNNECKYEIMKFFENEEEAFKYEHQMICEYKSKNQCKCNLDNGGVGGIQLIWTDEMKAYYSKYNVMKDKKQRERMSKNNPMKNKEIRDRVSRKLRKHPIIDSKYYESVEEASKEFNVSTYTIRQWCKKGINPNNQKCHWSNEPEKDIQFINPHCKRIIYDGVEYSSIKELCNTINKRGCVIANWLKKGFDTKGRICRLVGDNKEYVFKKTNTSAKPVIINNVWYESVIGACRKLNITEQTLRYHIKNKTGKYDFKYDNQ